MRKGQFFSVDFMLAVVTFSIIVIVSVLIWRNVDYRADRVDKRSEMEIIATTVVNTLLAGPGDPAGWYLLNSSDFTEQNIMAIGIMKNNGVLDVARVKKLEAESASHYMIIKNLTGVHNYDIDFQVTLLTGVSPLGTEFDNIAYTYAEGEPEEGDAGHYGLRNYMEQLGVDFDNYQADWQNLITNITQYNIAIFEDPTLDKDDFTAAQQTALMSWVQGGGVILQKEHGEMLEMFPEVKFKKEIKKPWPGYVLQEDPFIKWLKKDDHVIFNEGHRIDKSHGNWTELVVSDNNKHILIAKMQYGAGWIFYLPDTEGAITTGCYPVESSIEDVRDYIKAVTDANPGSEPNLDNARNTLKTAKDEVKANPPDTIAGFGNMEGAAGDISAAIDVPELNQSVGIELLNFLTSIAHDTAQDTIDWATAGGGNPTDITTANTHMATGDTHRTVGLGGDHIKFKDAIASYKNAVSKANDALPPAAEKICTKDNEKEVANNLINSLDLAGTYNIGAQVSGNEVVVVERFVPNEHGGTSMINVKVARND